MASLWDKFETLSELSIGYRQSPGFKSRIYGNGKNQVEVFIRVVILDSDNQILDLISDDLCDNIYLCEYQTGRRLDIPWGCSEVRGGFVQPVSLLSAEAEDLVEVKIGDQSFVSLYLSCSAPHLDMSFAVALDVPNVGVFDTSRDGTQTRNGPRGESGSWFNRPSYLEISTLAPVDYGLPEHITVRGMPKRMEEFETIVSDMKVYHHYGGNGSMDKSGFNGVSSKKQFAIHPKIPGYVFKYGDPVRNNVHVPNCKYPGDKPDMVRGHSGDGYDVQLIFVNQGKYGVAPDSNISMQHTRNSVHSCDYIIGPNDKRHQFYQGLQYGFVTVDVCNHRNPERFLKKTDWTNPGKPIRVDVTDQFGNSGVIRIENPERDDRWPQLYVNGVYHA